MNIYQQLKCATSLNTITYRYHKIMRFLEHVKPTTFLIRPSLVRQLTRLFKFF